MSVLSSGNPVPRYLRLAQLLRQRIEKGVWVSGEHLPKLEDLMAEFDVARVTVRQAIALLSQEGLVSAVRGKGTIVQALPLATARFAWKRRWPKWPTPIATINPRSP